MLEDPKRHTVCARALRLQELDAMPRDTWRLHVAKAARRSVRLNEAAVGVLRDAGVTSKDPLPTKAQDSIAKIATFLREQREQQAA